MFRTRNIILLSAAFGMIALALGVWKVLSPPEPSSTGMDSFGKGRLSYRALFELLNEIGFSASRNDEPPRPSADDEAYVLWGPDLDMSIMEPRYLNTLGNWVKSGKKIVLIVEALPDSSARRIRTKHDLHGKQTSAAVELGMPSIPLVQLDVREHRNRRIRLATPRPDSEREVHSLWSQRKSSHESQNQDGDSEFSESMVVTIHGEGHFSDLDSRDLYVPKNRLQLIAPTNTMISSDSIYLLTDDNARYTLAASYPVGGGKIVLISEPFLFSNAWLGQHHNSDIAAHIFAFAGKKLIFDEFYHGHGIRGNPLWLVTRYPYYWFFILILIAVLLWIWRQSITFGRPAPERVASRRNLQEYLDAMGNLLLRGKARRFILQELLAGVLWVWRKKLGLTLSTDATGQDVILVLRRRNPEKADQLQVAISRFTQIIDGRLKNRDVIETAREVTACL
jgi:hypothetical protein